ncbi:MAG: DUF305 domain-containing protein [Clostridium sp.]
MKKIIKYFCMVIISIVMICISLINVEAASDAQKKEFMNNHSEILKSIKECSDCTNGKGDIRIDFLEEVIHYNNIELCMAENIIKYSDNKDVRNLAKQIIRSSMDCNTEINEILYNINKNPSVDKECEKKYLNDYSNVYNKMILNLECKQDDSIEKIFIVSSIKHHESLIDLTNVFCKYSSDKELLESAKDIQKKNNKEIKKLKNSLKKF